MSLEELEAEALKLPPEQRERLAEKLLSSVDPGLQHEAEWAAEADRRVQQLREGSVQSVDAEEVLRAARKRLE